MKKTLKFHLISILAVLGFVFFWYLMTDVLHRVNTLILPGPVDVFRAFLNKMTNTRPDGGTLPEHTLSSLKLVLAAAIDGYSDPKALPQLAKQYRETVREIEEIEGAANSEDEIGEILGERAADGKSGAVRKSRT